MAETPGRKQQTRASRRALRARSGRPDCGSSPQVSAGVAASGAQSQRRVSREEGASWRALRERRAPNRARRIPNDRAYVAAAASAASNAAVLSRAVPFDANKRGQKAREAKLKQRIFNT